MNLPPEQNNSQLNDIKANAAMIEMNLDGFILDASPAFLSLFGYTLEELVGQPHTFLLFESKIESAKESAQSREYEAEKKNGQIFWVRGVSYPIFGATGKPDRLVQFVSDITAEKEFREIFPNRKRTSSSARETETFLKQAQKMAERINHEKSEFVTLLSHEIRTPLISLLGTADLLTETKLDSSQQEYAQILRRSGLFLLNLVNDLLDLSKIDAAALTLEETPFDLNELVASVLDILWLRAQGKGLRLSAVVDPRINPYRSGDPNRLRQVLINLIGNAIKFTESGEVQLEITSQDAFLEFKITDTGVGIPENKIHTLFQKFSQVDSSVSRKFGGTGLGLYISRSLVLLMGGEIWAENALHPGAVFRFRLCIAERPNPEHALIPTPLQGMKFFLAEPSFIFPSELIGLLQSWGASLEVVHENRALISGEYKAVLIDTQLYAGKAAELEHLLEQCKNNRQPVCLIFSSIKEAGQSTHPFQMIRPLKSNSILKTIYSMSADAPIPVVAPIEEKNKLSVLVAEDDPDVRFLIKAFSKSLPYDIRFAVNGQEALAFTLEYKFDLLLIDMQMPVMDGHTAIREIREAEKKYHLPRLPIIALTANSRDETDIDTLTECESHLSKPFDRARLIQTFEKYAKKKAEAA